MKINALIIIASLLFTGGLTFAELVSFESDRWLFEAKEHKIVNHQGQRALYLHGGIATVKDSQFLNGTIEFDISFSNERGFMGAAWRMQDTGNYEEFYLRPHQSGNPDANQYEPVFNKMAGWQLYYGEQYAAPVKYDFDKWMHIKILVAQKQAEFYIKDMNTPTLTVELKRNPLMGNVGLSVGNFAPAYFANYSFTPSQKVAIKGKAKPEVPAPAGTVMQWHVSNPFDSKSVEKKYRLEDRDQKQTWKKMDSEITGIANLGRFAESDKGRDTVFARVTISSNNEQVKKVRFGFSDHVKVYFNNVLIYGGNDLYQSRDYRFLGTVGLFDELYLPLKQGNNELWFAVTEVFGGWGIIALFEDMESIQIN
jgi:hypothetical protein